MFLYKTFDVDKVVNRKFVRVMDRGYGNIGFAVCEVKSDTLVVLCRGTLATRIAEIKGLMDERRMHRSARRTIARFKMKRLSMQQGRVLTKFKQSRNVRSLDKSIATLEHGVDTHIAL